MPNIDLSHYQRVFALVVYKTTTNMPYSPPISDSYWPDHGTYFFNQIDNSLTTTPYHSPRNNEVIELDQLEVKNFRLSTDRNKALLQALKKVPRTYVLKDVQVRDICKREKYYDYKLFRWRTRPNVTWVKRLVPVKRSLSALLKRQKGRVSNDLTFIHTSFPVRAMVTEVAFLFEHASDDPIMNPEGYSLKRRIVVNGSLLSLGIRELSVNPEQWLVSPVIDWDTGSLGLENELPPKGWPATYATDESLLLRFLTEVSELDGKCLPKLYSRLKDAKLDLATGLAEISQTVGLISSVAIEIGKSFLHLKKGNLFEALKLLVPKNRSEVSNAFLAFRYGVQPLMSDVEGAAQMLAERILNLPPQSVKTKKRSTIVSTEVLGDFTFTRTTVIDVKYAVFYDIDGTETLSNLSRLGFTSPVNVTWELVPFSFVLDWFLPIGNFLGSLSALQGYKLREIVKTVSIRHSVYCDFHVSSAPRVNSWYPETDLNSSWKVERLEVRRETIPSLPELPLPRFRNPFTVGRALNALALLSQMFKR